MTTGKTDKLRHSLTNAVAFLGKVLRTEASDVQQAAAIQAFEFTYELSWKLLQYQLQDQGVQAATPKAVFRAAGDAGLIDDVLHWFGYLDARNLTSHTYNEATANEVYSVITGNFVSDVEKLLGDC